MGRADNRTINDTVVRADEVAFRLEVKTLEVLIARIDDDYAVFTVLSSSIALTYDSHRLIAPRSEYILIAHLTHEVAVNLVVCCVSYQVSEVTTAWCSEPRSPRDCLETT